MARKCYMLIGLPCTGKTTYRKTKLLWDIRTGPELDNELVASTDDIIDRISVQYGVTYNACFKELYPFAEMIMKRDVNRWMVNEETFVWDQTNLTRESRAKKINLMLAYNYEIHGIFFDEYMTVIKERNLNRPGKFIPLDILEDMKSKFVMPELSEGFKTLEHVQNA